MTDNFTPANFNEPAISSFSELQPFYIVAVLTAVTTWLKLVTDLSILLTQHQRIQMLLFALTIPAITALLAYGFIQRQRALKDIDTQIATERALVTKTLEPYRQRVREIAKNSDIRLVFEPNSNVDLHISQQWPAPVIKISTGFWSTYSNHSDFVMAALAHEAGHVVARDSDFFVLLSYVLKILVFCVVTGLIAGSFLVAPDSDFDDRIRILLTESFENVFLIFGILLCWSALIVMREIQADTFAAQNVGTESISLLLGEQLRRRREQAVWNPITLFHRWLIQPNLAWRATLPILTGRRPLRLHYFLGLSMSAMLADVRELAKALYDVPLANDWVLFIGIFYLVLNLFRAWIVYRYCWFVNKTNIIRFGSGALARIKALISSLGMVIALSVPAFLLEQFGPFFIATFLGLPENERITNGDSIQTFPALFITIWSFSTFALRKEWSHRRPVFLRAVIYAALYWYVFRVHYIQLHLDEGQLFAIVALTLGVLLHLKLPRMAIPNKPLNRSGLRRCARPVLICSLGWSIAGAILSLPIPHTVAMGVAGLLSGVSVLIAIWLGGYPVNWDFASTVVTIWAGIGALYGITSQWLIPFPVAIVIWLATTGFLTAEITLKWNKCDDMSKMPTLRIVIAFGCAPIAAFVLLPFFPVFLQAGSVIAPVLTILEPSGGFGNLPLVAPSVIAAVGGGIAGALSALLTPRRLWFADHANTAIGQ